MNTIIRDKLETKSQGSRKSLSRNPFMFVRNINLQLRKPLQWRLKRLMDLSTSIIGLIILSPILLAITLAIKFESKGPVLFKQKRVGLYGREFYMYKFRSMNEDAEEQLKDLIKYNESDDITMFKLTDDPRVTKIGKIIRKWSLDEVPQLINIIKGEMSLVGPRPLPSRDYGFENYKDWHYLRYATLPGLSGLWQVSGRSDLKELDLIVKLDYKYIDTWDILLDIKILLKTLPVVLLSKGAV